MDIEVYQGFALAIAGIALATLGEALVEDRQNSGTARLTGRALRLLGLALIIGGTVTAALAYVFPAGTGGIGT